MIWKHNQTLNNGGSNSCLQYWHTTWHGVRWWSGLSKKVDVTKQISFYLNLTCKHKIDICEKMPATILAVQARQISIRYSKDGNTDWPWKGLEIANARMCEIQVKKIFWHQQQKLSRVQRQKIIRQLDSQDVWPWLGLDESKMCPVSSRRK